jgi:PPM family protein phosphatase
VSDAACVPNLPERISRFLDGRVDGRSPDFNIRELNTGDRLLLCSDGLSSVVPHKAIHDALLSLDGPDEMAGRLVKLAVDRGAPDNVTAIVLDAVSAN